MIKKSTIKNLKIFSYMLFPILIFIVSFVLIYYNIFKPKQQKLEKSMAIGYGYYSDPIEGPCVTKTGKCDVKGTQKITKKCIINPVTGKGCILKDGSMSYDNLVQTISCKKQCVGSTFESDIGLQYKSLIDDQNNIIKPITGSGGNKVINNLGINFTDEFVGDFDPLADGGNYKIKKCFNSNDYQVYSINNYNCVAGDSQKASNNCIFTCGVDDKGALRVPFVSDNNLGIKIPQYPKVNNKYSCLDIFGNNKIEVFNSGTIPTDFIYPNKCYSHFNKEGTDIDIVSSDIINAKQLFFTFQNITLSNHNLIYNYNFYYPFKLGTQDTMIERVTNYDYIFDQDLNNPGYVYIDMEKKYNYDKLYIGSGFETITSGNEYFLTTEDDIIAIRINYLSQALNPEFSNYWYADSKMVLNYGGTIIPVVGEYIYYKIKSYKINHLGDFAEITDVDLGTSSFKATINDLGENAYIYGINFWNMGDNFSKEINTTDGTNDGLTVENRIVNNYFTSDLLLPQIKYFSAVNNSVVNIINTSEYKNNKDDFYIYSKTNTCFYYPVSLVNRTNSTSFTLEDDYPGVTFYLLKDGIQQSVNPPNSNLNYKSFEEIIGTIESQVVTDSYKSRFLLYIKQIILLSSSMNGNNDIYGIINDKDNFYTIKNLLSTATPNIHVKKLDTIAKDISDRTISRDNIFVDKMKLYNDIFQDYDFSNKYGTDCNITISKLKAVILQADYSVYRTPNICFDQYNRNLEVGTKIQLNIGDNITYNVKDVLNSSDHNCGSYGVSDTVDRINYVPNLGVTVIPSTDHIKYSTYLDFLEDGYNLLDLKCLDENCREPYITRELKQDKFYNADEELYQTYLENKVYKNFTNDNQISWSSVKNYNDNEVLNIDDKVYSQKNSYTFVYNTKVAGSTGETPNNLGIYYLYNKRLPIFDDGTIGSVTFTQFNVNKNYYQNNWYSTEGDISNKGLQNIANYENRDNNFIYDMGISILSNSGNLYKIEIILETLNTFAVGDYINPDFNIFNSLLMEDGVSTFSFNNKSGYDELKSNKSIINNVVFKDNAKVNNLIFISYQKNATVNDINIFIYGDPIYNYAFEVCKILEINKVSKTVKLERNLLNYPIKNLYNGLFNNPDFDFVAYLLDSNINLDLIYPITKISNNIIYFNFSAYYNNEPIIANIIKNREGRTAFSARIIKKEIEITNSPINNGEKKLYLLSSPEKNKVSSYLDMIIKVEKSNHNIYYFNELSEDKYQDNNYSPNFSISDVINLSFSSGNNYQLQITSTKNVYNNILYDYESVSDLDIIEIPSDDNFFGVSYVNLETNIPLYNSLLLESVNPDHKTELVISTNAVESNIDTSDYTNKYYQGLPGSITRAYYLNNFSKVFENQRLLDIASDGLAKMTLVSTRLYPSLSNLNTFIEINNIVLNEKPYGPSYLNKLVQANDLDLNGYGTITSFDINDSSLINSSLLVDTIFKTFSGFKFSIANNVASFVFENLQKEAIKDYKLNSDIGKNELFKYNQDNKLLYRNINNVVNKFSDGDETQYDQPYYVLTLNLYKYPLYLKEVSGRIEFSYPNDTNIKLWYDSTTFINNATSKPSTNIYKEFVVSDFLSSNIVWKQIPDSIYPVNNVTNYNGKEYYENNDIIEYDNDVWQSQKENLSIAPTKFSGTSWALYNSYNQLYSKNNYFFNIDTDSSTSGVSLNLASKININNYPFSIIDYTNNKNYSLEIATKGVLNYQDQLIGSFLDLDYYTKHKNILAKVIMFQTVNNVITLASKEISKEDIDSYGFLKNSSGLLGSDILSQYFYNINLPDKIYAGKPFCTGNTPFNDNVSTYDFANSISFLPVPVDVEFQDYPFITFVEDQNVYTMPPNAVSSTSVSADVIIKDSAGVYRTQSVVYGRSYIKEFSQNIGNLNTGIISLVGSFGTTNFTLVGTSYNHIDVIDNKANTYYDNQSWILKNNKGKVAGGGLIKLETGTSLLLNSYNFFPVTLYNDDISNNIIEINNLNLGVSVVNINSQFSNTANYDGPGDYEFYEDTNLTNKYFTAKLDIDNDGNFLNFDEIYIQLTGLNDGDKIYFLPNGDDKNNLKTKFYGFFGNRQIAPINYQTKKLFPSNIEPLPVAIFSPFTNQLLNPIKQIEVLDSDGKNVIAETYEEEYYSDVFNLGVSNNKLTLKSNSFKYPVFNNSGGLADNIILPNSVGISGNLPIGIINSGSVIDLVSQEFYIDDYIVLGGISDILPVDNEFNSKSRYFSETKSGTNKGAECSIYENENRQIYPLGEVINSLIQKNTLLANSSTGPSSNINKILFDTNVQIVQTNGSNENKPIYVGISGGDEFKGGLIDSSYDIGTSAQILIEYYFNNLNIKPNVYRNLKGGNNFNTIAYKEIDIVIVKDNYSDTLADQTLYLGTSGINGPVQFSKGISTLVFTNY